MKLPMRVFWHLSGSVPRLLAGEDKSALELHTTAASPEAAEAMFQSLHSQSPDPVTITMKARIEASSVRDEAGLNDLRNM